MSLVNDLGIDEALQQFRSFRDDQFHANLAHDRKIKMLETENQELRSRLSVLNRLLILKGVFTAAETATFIVEMDMEARAHSTTEQTPPPLSTPEAG